MAPEISTTPTSTTGIETSEFRAGRSPRATQASRPTSTTWALAITVARPAPTASIEWCQNVRSAAKNTPAPRARRWSRRASGPKRPRSIHASTPSTGSAYAQRKTAAVEGETSACRTRMAEKAITRAPSTPAMRGRSFMRPSRLARGYGPAPVDRNSLMWTLVLFFGASVLFTSVRNLTDSESYGTPARGPGGGRALAGGRDRGLR